MHNLVVIPEHNYHLPIRDVGKWFLLNILMEVHRVVYQRCNIRQLFIYLLWY